jgi:uncharacterized protein
MNQDTHLPGTALITGGSSGIGLELARCFARDGHRLFIVADDVAKLESAVAQLRAEGASVEPLALDLRREDAAPAMFEEMRKRALVPDYLVLNAGTGAWGNFVGETDLVLELDSIRVNIASVVQAAKLFLPPMVARGSGRVLITSSLVATGPSPRLAVYAGTKAFLHSFAEAVREEIAASGVTITSLMPDLTQSDFFERAHVDPDSITAREPKADPATVAQAGYHAMMAGKDHVVTPLFSKFKAAVATVLPDALVTKIARAD